MCAVVTSCLPLGSAHVWQSPETLHDHLCVPPVLGFALTLRIHVQTHSCFLIGCKCCICCIRLCFYFRWWCFMSKCAVAKQIHYYIWCMGTELVVLYVCLCCLWLCALELLLKVVQQKLFTLAWLVRSPAFLPITLHELQSVVVIKLQEMMRFKTFSVFLMTCQGTGPLFVTFFFLCMKAGGCSFSSVVFDVSKVR